MQRSYACREKTCSWSSCLEGTPVTLALEVTRSRNLETTIQFFIGFLLHEISVLGNEKQQQGPVEEAPA